MFILEQLCTFFSISSLRASAVALNIKTSCVITVHYKHESYIKLSHMIKEKCTFLSCSKMDGKHCIGDDCTVYQNKTDMV